MLILFRYSEILGILSNLIKYYSINSSNMEIIRYDLIIYVDINKGNTQTFETKRT
jgi:hypothetical protein